jgi:1,2-diacylglycerol 3-beta-galactosyltransferase
MTNARPRISLIYIEAGGGHRAAANALAEVIREQNRPWDLELLSIQDLLDSIDFIRKWTGIPFQDIYNIMLRHGWTMGSSHLIRLMHLAIRLWHDTEVRTLEERWSRNRPDLVVSLIPHYNRALRESLARTLPRTPFVTILTDIADYPPHFWIEPLDQYVICGSEHAARQARQLGLANDRILRTSGMILNPRFYGSEVSDRAAQRVRLGLRPDLPTGLVLFGGEGSMDIVKVARRLNRPEIGVQLILLCGRHEDAAHALREMEHRIPMHIEGFTRDVPYWMELADFLIGKPGPGSISEALAKKLPVIVRRNAWTLAHERFNADWVESEGLGLVVRSFREIASAVAAVVEPANFHQFRSRAADIRNFAVYEIPDLLQKVLLTPPSAEQTAVPNTMAPPRERRRRAIPRWHAPAAFRALRKSTPRHGSAEETTQPAKVM